MRKLLTILLCIICTTLVGAKDIKIVWTGSSVTISPKATEGIEITTDDAYVTINNTLEKNKVTFLLSGASEDGSITYKGKSGATFVLKGVTLHANHGCAFSNKSKKHCVVELVKDNRLSDEAELEDTTSRHKAVLHSKGNLTIKGKGNLYIEGKRKACIRAGKVLTIDGGNVTVFSETNGVKGISCDTDFVMNDGNWTVTTKGSYRCIDTLGIKRKMMGPPPGDWQEGDSTFMQGGPGRPDFPGGPEFHEMPNMSERPDFSDMPDMSNFPDMPNFPDGKDFPHMHERPDMPDSLGHPDFQGGFPGGFPGGPGPGRGSYLGTAKAIKAMGTITINGGLLNVSTCSPAAEGIEGKRGVYIKGGDVKVVAYDDAVNSNGPIHFEGANVWAESTNNDAVDCNAWGKDAIVITGGTVNALSHIGAPEEGLDCDFSPITIQGGTVFTMGGGMGDTPSMPTEESVTQPAVLLQFFALNKDEKIAFIDKNEKKIAEFTAPFDMQDNLSLVSLPTLQQGETYKVEYRGKQYPITFSKKVITYQNPDMQQRRMPWEREH